MSFPIQISYRDVEHSAPLEALVRGEAQALEHLFARVISSRVMIEHVHHTAPFHARVELSVPGEVLFVNGSESHETYKTPELAVRNAFKKAKRQLLDYVNRRKS